MTEKQHQSTPNLDNWGQIDCSCGRLAKKATLNYKGYEVRGWKCVCGEQYILPRDSLKISAREKLKTHSAP